MNERIKQLERQATETVKCGLNGTSTAESFNRKKFAELIVTECARVADKAEPYQTSDLILKHFGVAMNQNLKAGADIHAGDGGYSVGTKEKYDEFVKVRNESLAKTQYSDIMSDGGLDPRNTTTPVHQEPVATVNKNI